MFETFEHTADLGLRIRAASLEELFTEAARALFAVVVEDAQTIRPVQRLDLTIPGDDREYLLFDWLRMLLYHFDAEHLLLGRFEVKLLSNGGLQGLQGSAWGEPLDRSRHELGHEVKAITYHGLLVEQTLEGWLAEVIVDI
jgi:SHS2 domain-containing protein